jgi:glucan 1,3-beta-glucosidase
MKLRAVNLGGWFVLERWMKQELFDGLPSSCNDETCFSTLQTNPDELLEKHYKDWITKDDLIWIKEQGINLVRVPIPWWFNGDGVYHKSIDAIDQAISTLEEIGLDYMLDLHTAPGCQNGFDNGGIQHQIEWHKHPENIDKTIEVLVEIMKRYNENPHFHSIQLLNEPNIIVPLELLQEFYKRSYQELRKVHPTRTIVMHDGFRLTAWKEFFTENAFTNVILDTHMYQCFDHNQHKWTLQQHCDHAKKRQKILQQIEQYVPVIVGEWSLGLRPNDDLQKLPDKELLQAYAQAQIEGMRDCSGHVFWSYKIAQGRHGWHMRRLIEEGMIDMKEFLK